MQRLPTTWMRSKSLLGALSSAVALWLLFVSFLAVYSESHAADHQNASHHEETCALCLFTHAHLEASGDIRPALVRSETWVQLSVPFRAALVAPADFLLLPGRAPPALWS